MIEKVGWDQTNGSEMPGLPSPIPGQGQKQSLHVNLPDPPAAECRPVSMATRREDRAGNDRYEQRSPSQQSSAKQRAGITYRLTAEHVTTK